MTTNNDKLASQRKLQENTEQAGGAPAVGGASGAVSGQWTIDQFTEGGAPKAETGEGSATSPPKPSADTDGGKPSGRKPGGTGGAPSGSGGAPGGGRGGSDTGSPTRIPNKGRSGMGLPVPKSQPGWLEDPSENRKAIHTADIGRAQAESEHVALVKAVHGKYGEEMAKMLTYGTATHAANFMEDYRNLESGERSAVRELVASASHSTRMEVTEMMSAIWGRVGDEFKLLLRVHRQYSWKAEENPYFGPQARTGLEGVLFDAATQLWTTIDPISLAKYHNGEDGHNDYTAVLFKVIPLPKWPGMPSAFRKTNMKAWGDWFHANRANAEAEKGKTVTNISQLRAMLSGFTQRVVTSTITNIKDAGKDPVEAAKALVGAGVIDNAIILTYLSAPCNATNASGRINFGKQVEMDGVWIPVQRLASELVAMQMSGHLKNCRYLLAAVIKEAGYKMKWWPETKATVKDLLTGSSLVEAMIVSAIHQADQLPVLKAQHEYRAILRAIENLLANFK